MCQQDIFVCYLYAILCGFDLKNIAPFAPSRYDLDAHLSTDVASAIISRLSHILEALQSPTGPALQVFPVTQKVEDVHIKG